MEKKSVLERICIVLTFSCVIFMLVALQIVFSTNYHETILGISPVAIFIYLTLLSFILSLIAFVLVIIVIKSKRVKLLRGMIQLIIILLVVIGSGYISLNFLSGIVLLN